MRVFSSKLQLLSINFVHSRANDRNGGSFEREHKRVSLELIRSRAQNPSIETLRHSCKIALSDFLAVQRSRGDSWPNRDANRKRERR